MSATLLAPTLPHNPEHTIERILDLACAQLEMDVAFVGRFEDGAEVVRAVAGDAESFGFTEDRRVPLEETYCERVVDGRLSGIVRDAQQNPIVRDLPATREARIGSYVGVPVRLWNGRVYGTLCCLGHDPDPSLDERDLKFMHVLAQLIADELDRESLEVHKRSIEAERIRRVIARHDIDMVFQPVFDIRDGAPVALEALARFWDEPSRPPAAWFAEAEEVGLGVELELAALEAALERVDEVPGGVLLAVNVSPATALSPRFAELVEDVADRLVIELTEHAQVVSYEELAEALAPIRSRGARLAIDDVGAGFASLRHIIRLAPDIVKLDLSLTSGIADDPALVALASSLVDFADGIHATIAAEGIETKEELALLRRLGVAYGQGFYLGRPTALMQ
jgi:EAL domain-containing protein (putative c-di-GMP-specific phosphodiesterase class I)